MSPTKRHTIAIASDYISHFENLLLTVRTLKVILYLANLESESRPKSIGENVRQINSDLSSELWLLVSGSVKKWCEDEIAQRIRDIFELIDAYDSERVRIQGENEVQFSEHTSRRNQALNFFGGFLPSVKRNTCAQVMDYVASWPIQIQHTLKNEMNRRNNTETVIPVDVMEEQEIEEAKEIQNV